MIIFCCHGHGKSELYSSLHKQQCSCKPVPFFLFCISEAILGYNLTDMPGMLNQNTVAKFGRRNIKKLVYTLSYLEYTTFSPIPLFNYIVVTARIHVVQHNVNSPNPNPLFSHALARS